MLLKKELRSRSLAALPSFRLCRERLHALHMLSMQHNSRDLQENLTDYVTLTFHAMRNGWYSLYSVGLDNRIKKHAQFISFTLGTRADRYHLVWWTWGSSQWLYHKHYKIIGPTNYHFIMSLFYHVRSLFLCWKGLLLLFRGGTQEW